MQGSFAQSLTVQASQSSKDVTTSPEAIEVWNGQPWPPASRNASDRDSIGDNDPKPDFVSSPRRLLTAPELLDAPDEWVSRSLSWVDFVLKSYPPSLEEYPVRRAALIRMDDILHIETGPRKTPVQAFYKYRIEEAISEIEQTHVTQGMRIWKLYNHGFFVRTPSVSFVFDIVPGGGDQNLAMSAAQIRRLAIQADVAFISHLHGDHANKDVVRTFLGLGKPVIAPPGLWEDDPEFRGKLRYPTRSRDKVESVAIGHGRQALTFIAYPGHQGRTVQNNVYLVTTPEHFEILHTGDQSPPSREDNDLNIFDDIGRTHQVDVLLPNVWTVALLQIIRSVHPKLVISGHENELYHKVPHREDYTQSFTRLYGASAPYLVMTWGESYQYSASPKKNTR